MRSEKNEHFKTKEKFLMILKDGCEVTGYFRQDGGKKPLANIYRKYYS